MSADHTYTLSEAFIGKQRGALTSAILGNDAAATGRLAPKVAMAGAINAPLAGGVTFLHLAVYSRQLAIVSAMIDAGSNVCAVDDKGRTPLFYLPLARLVERARFSVEFDNTVVRGHFGNDRGMSAIARKLLIAGANPFTQAEDGVDFVAMATRLGCEELCRMLVCESRVSPDALLSHGYTMLMIAAGMGHTNLVWFLLECGANPRLRHAVLGATAYDLAIQGGHALLAVMLAKSEARTANKVV